MVKRLVQVVLAALLAVGLVLGTTGASGEHPAEKVQGGGAEVTMYLGTSMGGTASLNALLHGKEAPPCWYGVKAAVDMSTIGNVPGANGFIRKAYGGGPYPRERNPVDTAYKLARTGTIFRFVASLFDPYVPYDANTGRLSAALQGFGADVSVRTVQGPHDDPSHYSAYDVVRFADECAAAQGTKG